MRLFVLVAALPFLLAAEDAGMPKPKFSSDGKLVRPEGYREWMFVGSSLGMGYTEGQAPAKPTFHNIYIQREAFQEYKRSGKFPENTMLVMDVLNPGKDVSINKQGAFSDQFVGFEVALKSSRVDGGWAYYNFISPTPGKPLAESKAFEKDRCWNCHNKHGAFDNVFLQFYPALREARPVAAKNSH